jgi:MscS family membrane protein
VPQPRVRFRSFGDSALEFELLGWVAAPADRGLVEHQMNKAVFYAFKDAGVEIPFPQRVVHLKVEPEGNQLPQYRAITERPDKE